MPSGLLIIEKLADACKKIEEKISEKRKCGAFSLFAISHNVSVYLKFGGAIISRSDCTAKFGRTNGAKRSE